MRFSKFVFYVLTGHTMYMVLWIKEQNIEVSLEWLDPALFVHMTEYDAEESKVTAFMIGRYNKSIYSMITKI